tara:strand:+ start:1600 stop:2487 length:888 start_codon:yes stop_codon:yes gene_type:complete
MKVAYTPIDTKGKCNQFSIIDTETLEKKDYGFYVDIRKDKVCGREEYHKHRPFGLTWNNENLFVANRTNLIKFDKNLNQVKHYDIFYGNPHQILEINGKIYSADTTVNAINVFDIKTEKVEKLFDPEKQKRVEPKEPVHFREMDVNHINSLHYDGNFLYILLHNWMKKASEYLKCDLNLKIIKRQKFNAFLAHCVFIDKGHVSTLDTGKTYSIVREDYSRLLVTNGYHDFIRGYASTENFHVVGVSNRSTRNCRLIIINKKDYYKKEIKLEDCWDLADLRIIDQRDYSHNKEKFI